MHNKYVCILYLGQSCIELIPPIVGSEIEHCTSGRMGEGHRGDTCIVTYRNTIYQVNELWSCQDNMAWTFTSGDQYYMHIVIYYTVIY